MRRSISGVFDEASLAGNRAKLQAVASAFTESVIRTASRELPASVVPALHRALDELGPVMGEAIRDHVEPSISAALRTPGLESEVSEAVRALAKQAVLGANEGLEELSTKQQFKNASGGPLGSLFGQRVWLLFLLGAAIVLAIPVVMLRRERAAARRFREETERRHARAAALLQAMQASRDEGSLGRILEMLREQLDGDVDKPGPPVPPHPPEPRHA